MGTSCNFSSSTPRPSPSPTRLRLVGLGLGLGVLERSRPSTPPPAVVLIPKSKELLGEDNNSHTCLTFEGGEGAGGGGILRAAP